MFHKRYIRSVILMLFLSEGQAGEAWEPSKTAVFFGISRNTGQHKERQLSGN
jgi:hypothetical protein